MLSKVANKRTQILTNKTRWSPKCNTYFPFKEIKLCDLSVNQYRYFYAAKGKTLQCKLKINASSYSCLNLFFYNAKTMPRSCLKLTSN